VISLVSFIRIFFRISDVCNYKYSALTFLFSHYLISEITKIVLNKFGWTGQQLIVILIIIIIRQLIRRRNMSIKSLQGRLDDTICVQNCIVPLTRNLAIANRSRDSCIEPVGVTNFKPSQKLGTQSLTRDIDIGILSVRLSVTHVPLLYRNGLAYHHN